MAITVNGFTITSIETLAGFNRETGVWELYLKELTDAKISCTEDITEITGKGGRILKQIKKNKGVTVSGTSALMSADLMAAQLGAESVFNEKTKIRTTETIVVEGTTAVTVNTAVGTVGAEIVEIRKVANNGALTDRYTQAEAASEDKFAYNPGTKTITLPTNVKAGDIVAVIYDYETEGCTITDLSDVYGKTLYTYVTAIGVDVCDVEYKCQFVIPRLSFSGATDIEMSSDSQVTQAFEGTVLVDSCAGADAKLFDFIVFK